MFIGMSLNERHTSELNIDESGINDIHSITCQLRWVWPKATG